jgi:hypothetical protein
MLSVQRMATSIARLTIRAFKLDTQAVPLERLVERMATIWFHLVTARPLVTIVESLSLSLTLSSSEAPYMFHWLQALRPVPNTVDGVTKRDFVRY